MVSVYGLTKTFKSAEKPAVANVSFNLEKGKITAILGENGAGKTTILKIIAGILKPNTGSGTVCGYDILKEIDKTRKKIGLLLGSETGLYDRLTAKENVLYFADLYSVDKEQAEKKLKDFSIVFDMESYLDKKCNTFSKGMKQKTALARAFIHNPEVMLLDEPAAGLDISAIKTLHRFLIKNRDEGKTIFLSSHNISEVKEIADFIIIINKGIILEQGKIEELKDKYKTDIEEIYLGLLERGRCAG